MTKFRSACAKLLTISVLTILPSNTLNAQQEQPGEPFKARCGPNDQVHVDIVGEQSDLLEVWDGRRLVFRDFVDARQSMDGRPISCDDLHITRDLVVARLGHQDDILHAYHLIRGAQGKVYKVSFLIDRFRDGELNVEVRNWDVLVRAGNKGDLFFRRCAGWQNRIGEWGRSSEASLRVPSYAPCTETLPTSYTYGEDRRHGGWGIYAAAVFPVNSATEANSDYPSPFQYGYNSTCTNNIPRGWIRVESDGYESRCDQERRQSRDRTNAWYIAELARVPIGNTLNACRGEVPRGWRREQTYYSSGSCENSWNSNDLGHNRMIIRRAE